MIKLTDLTFYANLEEDNPLAVIQSQKPSYGYISFIKERVNISVVKHFGRDEKVEVDGVSYTFFKGRNKPWYISLPMLRHLAKERPNVIVVQGLGFPIQIIALRLWLGKKVTIIAQHHAERPMPGWGSLFQRMADRHINAYLFTAPENAMEWFEQKIIKDKNKYHQLLELSTAFARKTKQEARNKTGMPEGEVFLWVGRLEANKDPLTVLKGFAMYLTVRPTATLYMAYQENDLLQEVVAILNSNIILKSQVCLLGKIKHGDLPDWFSAADFYLSGSHREGSGTALIEAMACGCIPVVTNIPSFRMITGGGAFGYLYQPGNAANLCDTLKALPGGDRENIAAGVVQYFEKRLSFKAIADDLFSICNTLVNQTAKGNSRSTPYK
jgi:glycosyltransferase involved in cell wall biosynthesis